jgi:hypothetical protein
MYKVGTQVLIEGVAYKIQDALHLCCFRILASPRLSTSQFGKKHMGQEDKTLLAQLQQHLITQAIGVNLSYALYK